MRAARDRSDALAAIAEKFAGCKVVPAKSGRCAPSTPIARRRRSMRWRRGVEYATQAGWAEAMAGGSFDPAVAGHWFAALEQGHAEERQLEARMEGARSEMEQERAAWQSSAARSDAAREQAQTAAKRADRQRDDARVAALEDGAAVRAARSWIDPALPPPAGTLLPTATEVEPARPFEDFLDGGVPEGDIAHGRAFGFAELGMFGRDERGQSPAQSLLPGKIPAEFVAVPTPIENFDEPVGRTAALEPGAATSTGVTSSRPGTSLLDIARARPGGSIVPTSLPDAAGALLHLQSPFRIDEGAAPAVATARRVERPRLARSEVSLIMIVRGWRGGAGRCRPGARSPGLLHAAPAGQGDPGPQRPRPRQVLPKRHPPRAGFNDHDRRLAWHSLQLVRPLHPTTAPSGSISSRCCGSSSPS